MGGNGTGYSAPKSAKEPSVATGWRGHDAIYQDSRIVARAVDTRADDVAHEIHFGELYSSGYLTLPDVCEFQRYRIVVQRIGYAAREEKRALRKGRILRDMTADIQGYREQ